MSYDDEGGPFIAPHETAEFMPVLVYKKNPVTGEKTPILTGVEFAITTATGRPVTADWGPAVPVDGKIGVNISGYSAGRRAVWARIGGVGGVVTNPEFWTLT